MPGPRKACPWQHPPRFMEAGTSERVLTNWHPNVFSTPTSNPKFFSARKSMKSLKSRQLQLPRDRSVTVGPFPVSSVWAGQRFHHWGGASAAPLFRCKLVPLAGDGKGDITTKLTFYTTGKRWGLATLPYCFLSSPSQLPCCACPCAGRLPKLQVKTGTCPQLYRLAALAH